MQQHYRKRRLDIILDRFIFPIPSCSVNQHLHIPLEFRPNPLLVPVLLSILATFPTVPILQSLLPERVLDPLLRQKRKVRCGMRWFFGDDNVDRWTREPKDSVRRWVAVEDVDYAEILSTELPIKPRRTLTSRLGQYFCLIQSIQLLRAAIQTRNSPLGRPRVVHRNGVRGTPRVRM